MKDLFAHTPVSQPRAFAACYRLVAQGALLANLDHVLWEYSRLQLAANLRTAPAPLSRADARRQGSVREGLAMPQITGRAA
jgi:hypothetical protein